MKLGPFVRAKRTQLGLSMRGLAEKCGVSFASVSRIESGAARDVTVATVVQLSKGLRQKPTRVFEAAVETLEEPK